MFRSVRRARIPGSGRIPVGRKRPNPSEIVRGAPRAERRILIAEFEVLRCRWLGDECIHAQLQFIGQLPAIEILIPLCDHAERRWQKTRRTQNPEPGSDEAKRRGRDYRRRVHGRERRLSSRAAWRHRRRAARAREDARRPDRPGAMPAACAISSRTRRTSGCRSNRSACSSVSPTKSATRSIFIRTAISSCSRRRRSVETFQANVELQRGLGVDVQWLDAAEAARLAPGLNTDGVLAATFCQRDGIADPNGVTMGFAKTAQALGVTIERDVEVDRRSP